MKIPLRSDVNKRFRGNVVGLGITNQDEMVRLIEVNCGSISNFLNKYEDSIFIPIISTFQPNNKSENDAQAFIDFTKKFGITKIAGTEILDYRYWYDKFNVVELANSIYSCDTLITQRKHNLIHAIREKVSTVAIYPASDDSLERVFNALPSHIPKNSILYPLNG